MRILHTSDWHLGARTGSLLRAADHDIFLDWLVVQLDLHEIDALIIAGDVFDVAQPSAEAMAQYYGFLRRARHTGVRDIVVVGGNHDSPSRLDAPREVLAELCVHVVGGLPDDRDRLIVPLYRRDGEIGAVCCAVPYVHEYRLGVRTTDLDRALIRSEIVRRLVDLYRESVDLAEMRYPGLPVVATGHLALGRFREGDQPHLIHQVGLQDVIPPDVLDRRLAYVALGHIHRSQGMLDGRAWYSGSPIALTLPETEQPRCVLRVELGGRESVPTAPPKPGRKSTPVKLALPLVGATAPEVAAPAPRRVVNVERIYVPVPRELIRIRGTSDEVIARVRALTWTTPLVPAVRVEVQLRDAEPAAPRRVQEAVDSHPADARPVIVEVTSHRVEADIAEGPPIQTLVHLTPGEVFARRLAQMGVTDDGRLSALYQWLRSTDDEQIDAHVADLEAG